MRVSYHRGAPAWTMDGWAKIENVYFDDGGKPESIILGLDADNRRLVLRPDEVCLPMFFGVVYSPHNDAGHYLYGTTGRQIVHHQDTRFYGQPIDGQMQPRSTREHGAALLSKFATRAQTSWTILGMWDYSGDSRGGSNMTFFFGGERSFDEMIELAKKFFPSEVKRIEEKGPIHLVSR